MKETRRAEEAKVDEDSSRCGLRGEPAGVVLHKIPSII